MIRIVEGVSGRVPMSSALRMRFSYGRVVPTVYQHEGRTVAVAGPDSVWFDTEAEAYSTSQTTQADFTVVPGDRVAFTISWQPSHQEPPAVPVPETLLEATEDFWLAWVEHCTYDGPYREAVVRSLITLKALTSASTGGIVAAPTTSLPEEIGGVRNWDYRYVWLRDAALSVSSLVRAGFRDEARAWRVWLLRAVAGDPQNLQIMYGVGGERDLPEAELGWLPGFENSRPVRVGNAAVAQLQLDVYGEVTDALYLAGRYGLDHDHASTQLLITLVTHLESQWEQPDEGIWEVRGPRRHFVHSKVMAWTAVDRAVRLIEAGHAHGPLARWRKLRTAIHQDVCEGLRPGTQHVHPVLRFHEAGRRAPGDLAGRLPAAGRQARDRDGRGDPARAVDERRIPAALHDRRCAYRRGRPAGRRRSLPPLFLQARRGPGDNRPPRRSP